MAKRFKKRNPAPGSMPGTLAHPLHESKVLLNACFYDNEREEFIKGFETSALSTIKARQAERYLWLDVQGPLNAETLALLARIFGIHPLAQEDIVNVPSRPKSELYPSHQLVVGRMALVPKEVSGQTSIELEQVSFLITKNSVLTFQERPGDVFDAIRRRLKVKGSLIRSMGADYLAYALIDAMVDGYYPVLEHLGQSLEHLDQQILTGQDENALQKIHQVRGELTVLRRALWPQREAVAHLIREPSPFFGDEAKLYLRDVHDHCMQVVDVIESYRDEASGLANLYLSLLGNKTNDVMKVLTIVASIFIPLTFFAGVYGMNFEYIPELKWKWAYPTFWLVNCLVAGSLWTAFRRLGWLGGKKRNRPSKERGFQDD